MSSCHPKSITYTLNTWATLKTRNADPERAKRVSILQKVIHDLTVEQEKNPEFKTIGDYYSELMDMLWDLSDMEKYLN